MNVPLVDLKYLYLSYKEEVDEALSRVLDSQCFIMGPEVLGFEQEMAGYLGPEVTCIGTSSGTCALYLSVMALEPAPGDEVIIPAYSFIASANTVSLNGARPVFVDVEPDTLNLDCEQVADRVTDRTRAVIPVHLFGRAVDMDRLEDALAAAGRSDIVIVEDVAQALGATFRGRRLGTIGTFGCLSFFPSKNLGGFGDGGMVASTVPRLAEIVRILRTHGGRDRYHNTRLGVNGRLDAIQAAVLRTRLKHLDDWIAQRRKNAAHYRRLFEQADLLGWVGLPADDGDGRFVHTYNSFNLRVSDRFRDPLRKALQESEVGTAVYYPIPLPYQPCFAELGYQPGDFPNAERGSREILAIPIYPGIGADAQEYVVDCISRFFRSR